MKNEEAAFCPRHVMLDIETLGITPGCAIVSIGACAFDIANGVKERFYQTIRPDPRFRIDGSTVYWWMAQSEEARKVFDMGTSVDITTALHRFNEWCSGLQPDPLYIWCHGATFDAPILSKAYEIVTEGHNTDMRAPFSFYNIRDTRTIYHLSGIYPDRTKGVHHNALDDAVAQAEAVIESYMKLGVSL